MVSNTRVGILRAPVHTGSAPPPPGMSGMALRLTRDKLLCHEFLSILPRVRSSLLPTGFSRRGGIGICSLLGWAPSFVLVCLLYANEPTCLAPPALPPSSHLLGLPVPPPEGSSAAGPDGPLACSWAAFLLPTPALMAFACVHMSF